MTAQADILVQAIAATTFAKAGVDLIKKSAIPSPSWLLPLLAVVIGELAAFLLLLYSGETLTRTTSAGAILAGFLAACGAVGVTELQRSADSKS